MSNLTVASLTGPASQNGLILATPGSSFAAQGSVIQVVNTTISTPTAVGLPAGAQIFTDVPNLILVITPKAASSKIYVTARWFGEYTPQNANWDSMFTLKRNGTVIVPPGSPVTTNPVGIAMAAISYYADDGASTPEMTYMDYWDSPNTIAAVTYQVCVVTLRAATTLYTNRTVNATSGGHEYGFSSITAWEIAQ